jgi:hypothetical protein
MSDVDPSRFDRIAATELLLDSFRHWLGRDLVAPDGTPLERAERLFDAPFVVVAHGTEPDPILFYGNRTALDLWELDEETLRRTPSRRTAEPVHRDERARLLERTRREGFVDDYRGIRVTSTGRRFLVERAIVWNLLDAHGRHAGQAATFDRWTYLDAQPTGGS